MRDHTKIKILDLDDIESIILQEITVAEAEKIIGGDVPQIKVEPAINECKVLFGGNCSCQGENKKCRLIDFSLIVPDLPVNVGRNQSYLEKSSITSKLIDKVNLK